MPGEAGATAAGAARGAGRGRGSARRRGGEGGDEALPPGCPPAARPAPALSQRPPLLPGRRAAPGGSRSRAARAAGFFFL